MTEEQLAELLNQYEPAQPRVDRPGITKKLTLNAQTRIELARNSVPIISEDTHEPTRLSPVAFAMLGVALSVLFVSAISAHWWKGNNSEQALSRTLRHEEDTRTDDLPSVSIHPASPEFTAEDKSRADSLEAELSAALADLQPPITTTLASSIRASESLWMILEGEGLDSNNSTINYQSIVNLYPDSPAAQRSRSLLHD